LAIVETGWKPILFLLHHYHTAIDSGYHSKTDQSSLRTMWPQRSVSLREMGLTSKHFTRELDMKKQSDRNS
jgi:hypothetical protein